MARDAEHLERRLLILAPLGRDAALIVARMAKYGVACVVCRDMEQLTQEVTRGAAAVIVSEEAVTGQEERLGPVIRAQPPWSDLPVLLLTRTGADSSTAARATDSLGNVTLLERPIRVAAFESAVRSALRARARQYEARAHLEALRGSEARFRALVTASSDVVYRMSADWSELRTLYGRGLLIDTNAPTTSWLGEYIDPEDQPRVTAAIEAAVSAKSVFELEHRVRRSDGTQGWVLSRAVPLLDNAGDITEWFGAASDVTVRKHAEEALRVSEEKYRTLFDSIHQGLCIIEVLFDEGGKAFDYRFLELNPAFERQTGLVGALGKTMRELVPEHEAHWYEVYGHIARTGIPARFEALAAALGRFYDVYALRIGGPGQHRVAVLFEDIATRKKAEEALREADRRKDEFLAILAHELRNPLAPIRNGLQIARLSSKPNTPFHRTVEMMDRQLSHLVRLVDDLLDVGRITSGKIQLRRVRILLADVLANSIEGSQASIDAKQHELVVDEGREPLIVVGDFDRLSQVFSNILSNAAKYTNAGGRIAIQTRREGDEAVVRVSDTGIGIAPDDLPYVFDLFSQAGMQDGHEGGLGIGLGLVRRLVEMHEGRVYAESSGLGQGSAFTVRLPIAADETQPLAGSGASAASLDRAAPRRILVVDDNADAADSLAMMLSIDGHDVRVAYDGPHAIDMARSIDPDIVFLDIGMPGMDGIATARRLRALPRGAAMQLIALTGWGQEHDRERTREAGFDRHLVKPVDRAGLGEILQERSSA